MKKCMIVRASSVSMQSAKKVARQLKKAHEKLWGAGTCEVVVVPDSMEVVTLCEEWSVNSLASCSVEECSKSS